MQARSGIFPCSDGLDYVQLFSVSVQQIDSDRPRRVYVLELMPEPKGSLCPAEINRYGAGGEMKKTILMRVFFPPRERD